jgi:hypothetical protein
MSEPGLDLHEWESEWGSLEDDIADSPETALPYVHELMTRMMRKRGILDPSLVATEGADPDYVRTWQAGAELVAAIEDPGVEVEREDVVEAIENYRELFETFLAERAPP